MLTKQKIATLVLNTLHGGQVSSFKKATPRQVYERIETVRNLFLEQQMKEFGELDGEFITQYRDVTVVKDAGTNKFYSTLPSEIISFGEHSGLRQVSPMKNQELSFIKMANGSESTFAGLEAGQLHGNTGYYIERVKVGTNQSIRIYYKNIPFQYDKVLVKMVASVYDFNENEALPIPAKYEEQLILAVGQAFNPQFKIPVEDKSV